MLLPNVSLPILTISCAHLAKTLGAFGLVAGGFTNLYHASDLSPAAGVSPLPSPPPAPQTELNTLIMKHPFTKTLAVAIAMSSAAILLHYLIGSMSY